MSTSWKVEGSRLLLRRDYGTGNEEHPFFVRGVCYGPTPVGHTGGAKDWLVDAHKDVWGPDIKEMRRAGFNALRVYGSVAGNDYKPFLDAAWNGGVNPIYVVLSIWIEPKVIAGGPAAVAALREQYKTLAKDNGAHDAVLGFSIGAEINRGAQTTKEFWDAFREIAVSTRDGLKECAKTKSCTKILTTGLIDDLDKGASSTLGLGISHGASVDVWGFDVYRGPGAFTSELWPDVDGIYHCDPIPPLLIGEFGYPASYHPTHTETERTVAELPEKGPRTMGQLESALVEISRAVETRSAVPRGKDHFSCGGFVFEWTDEWWKQDPTEGSPSSCFPGAACTACGPSCHDGSTEKKDHYPGGWNDEEWFGLNAVKPSGPPNPREPRPTLKALAKLALGRQGVAGASWVDFQFAVHRIAGDGAVYTYEWPHLSRWVSLGAPAAARLTGGIAAVSWRAGAYGVYATGDDGKVHQKWGTQSGTTRGWGAWESIGAPPGVRITNAISAVSWAAHRYGIYAVGDDGKLWQTWTADEKFSNWESLDSPSGHRLSPLGAAAVAYTTAGPYAIYAVADNGEVWQKYWSAGWSGWESMSKPSGVDFTGEVTAVKRLDRLYGIFAMGKDGRLYEKWWYGKWADWLLHDPPAGRSLVGALGSVRWSDDHFCIFAVADNGEQYMHTCKYGKWEPWEPVTGLV